MLKAKKKTVAVVASLATAGILTLGGIAYAVFTETSNADAAGAAANMQPLAVGTGDDAPKVDYAGNETKLWPNVGGSHVAAVRVKVTNGNEVAVKVPADGITGSVNFDDGADQAACGAYLKLTSTLALAAAPVTVGAGVTKELVITGVYLEEAAPNTCQDKPFTTHWTITGTAQ